MSRKQRMKNKKTHKNDYEKFSKADKVREEWQRKGGTLADPKHQEEQGKRNETNVLRLGSFNQRERGDFIDGVYGRRFYKPENNYETAEVCRRPYCSEYIGI